MFKFSAITNSKELRDFAVSLGVEVIDIPNNSTGRFLIKCEDEDTKDSFCSLALQNNVNPNGLQWKVELKSVEI